MKSAKEMQNRGISKPVVNKNEMRSKQNAKTWQKHANQHLKKNCQSKMSQKSNRRCRITLIEKTERLITFAMTRTSAGSKESDKTAAYVMQHKLQQRIRTAQSNEIAKLTYSTHLPWP